MATALGMGIVQNVDSDLAAANNAVLYTVPAGNYAYINMISVTGTVQIENGSSDILGSITSPVDIYLDSGSTLNAIGVANVGYTVIEYKNP